MDPTQTTPPLLDNTSADFIRHHVSINVASRDARNLPAVARAFGCCVSADRRSITVFLAPVRAATAIKNLRDNGAIAVAVSRPSTHESLQLKGVVTKIARVTETDREAIVAYLHSLAEELTDLGHEAVLIRSADQEVNEECLAVTFEPDAAFVQTPGTQAGRRLETNT